MFKNKLYKSSTYKYQIIKILSIFVTSIENDIFQEKHCIYSNKNYPRSLFSNLDDNFGIFVSNAIWEIKTKYILDYKLISAPQ